QYCSKTGIDTSLVVSVVFPELIRYSYLSDFFETSALELIYTEYGCEAADFSIGRFQMRPSFIENLEKYVAGNSDLINKYGFICDFIGDSQPKIRAERIARLKILKWELIYICCFADIIASKFPNVQQKEQKEKIKFFASAYNHGFDTSSNEIINWIDAKYFPFGQSATCVQYSYCDIAYDFYEH
ncbi:MAG: hypothetical protein HY738_18990, partial [Bacteroidia bacterium]|nr:hypothetical protein [Bacteroidia bacterium]